MSSKGFILFVQGTIAPLNHTFNVTFSINNNISMLERTPFKEEIRIRRQSFKIT